MHFSSIVSFFFFLFYTTLFASASPIDGPTSNQISKRATEDDALKIILDLKAKVDVIIPEIDVLTVTAGDPTDLLAEISADVDVAVTALLALTPDDSGVEDGTKDQIATVVIEIIVNLCTVLVKFPLTVVFLQIFVVVDLFFKKLLLALDVTIVGIIKIIVKIFTQADIDLLVKLKFVETLKVLGIIV